MTQEGKQLVLNDISSRLPYGVMMHVRYCDWSNDDEIKERDVELTCYNISYAYEDVWHFYKPYLRPMSSMTEEERRKFSIFIGKTEVYVQQVCLDADSMANPIIGGGKCVYWGLFDRCIDWLNEHHFDFRGLISKGLALEAPEGMYII